MVLAEGSKGPILAERKYLRCFSSRADGSRNYMRPGSEIWLYLRKHADGEIKYFVCNAPRTVFEECKSNLGMGHYECRSYKGWNRHMLFVMIAHLFTIQIREIFKKSNSIDYTKGYKTNARDNGIYSD